MGGIIVGCRYSVWLCRLCGSHAVPALATLFLMSYTKLLLTVTNALSMSQLPCNDSILTDLFIGERSIILGLSQVNTAWNILLPVGEGTAMFRDFVLPRVLENFVDIFEWVETCSLNEEVFLSYNEEKIYNSVFKNSYS